MGLLCQWSPWCQKDADISKKEKKALMTEFCLELTRIGQEQFGLKPNFLKKGFLDPLTLEVTDTRISAISHKLDAILANSKRSFTHQLDTLNALLERENRIKEGAERFLKAPLNETTPIHFTFTVTTSVIPGIPGCYWSSSSIQYFMSYILFFVFQLGMSPGTGSIPYRCGLPDALHSTGPPHTHTCHTKLAVVHADSFSQP
ncbi:hypothetical protein DEU56DRAFT_533913 [Suillus clintonianus]|uniref:uncharacterized protein n=1 Tax=Suillus clintonianus TaxID=1904413 RepID=UPI001B85D00E|nr:uncharacterized protein DEU56DRAFT_533913 [Suillus clintonianus]KAG2127133.1 hypothetical protein DEU56DRAFT_533913 [Suillus clintonianus]